MKLFIANKRAEILRAQASEEERLRAEQVVRSAAVAVAGRAFEVVRELVARNARMSRRVAGLRTIVEVRIVFRRRLVYLFSSFFTKARNEFILSTDEMYLDCYYYLLFTGRMV